MKNIEENAIKQIEDLELSQIAELEKSQKFQTKIEERQSKSSLTPVNDPFAQSQTLYLNQSNQSDLSHMQDSIYPEKKTDGKKPSFKIKSRPNSQQGGRANDRPSLKKIDRDLIGNKNPDMLKDDKRRPSETNLTKNKTKVDKKIDSMASTKNLAKIEETKEKQKESAKYEKGIKIMNHLE